MAGTWANQNKILPGAYINFLTDAPLSITPGDRGIVVLLQEMSTGTAGEMYKITASCDDEFPNGSVDKDRLLVNEALKGAQTVIIYNLGKEHTAEVISKALTDLRTVDFSVLSYPYNGENYTTNKETISNWVKAMRDDEGVKIQAVLADYDGNYEGIINVVQGVKLSDGTELTPAQVAAWVAGISAGANVNESNTGKKYGKAIDVVPRMTKTEMETAVTMGKFILKVDTAQNVSVVYDINSLTEKEKGSQFKKTEIGRAHV